MIRGQPIFDGLTVMEFSCNFLGETIHLEAKAAFVQISDVGEHKGGATHGSTTGTRWSTETMKKLIELRDAMEQDLAQRHFHGAGRGVPGITAGDVGGIGENLEDEDGTKQI